MFFLSLRLPLQTIMCPFMSIGIKATPLLTYCIPVGNGPINMSDILTSQSRHNQYHTCSSSFIPPLFLPRPHNTHTISNMETFLKAKNRTAIMDWTAILWCHKSVKLILGSCPFTFRFLDDYKSTVFLLNKVPSP